MTAVQLAGSRHFLEFFSHKVSYRSRPPAVWPLFKRVSGQKPREIAVEVLGHRGERLFTEEILERALATANLSGPDRRLCQELVYGVVRWQSALDWLIARKTADRAQNPALQNLLRLGLYQIFWLERIPDHAAVNVTVELAKQRGFGPQAGFVNAVLRGYLREFDATRARLEQLKQERPALGFSHPQWLVDRWTTRWGKERTLKLLEWNNTPPRTFARVNSLKIDAERLLPVWRDEGVEYDFFHRDWFPVDTVFELKSHPPLSQLPSFQKGFFYVQDPSTLLAVTELAPRPGESVLDMCAAPGGKLTYIAQTLANQGRIIAHDTDSERLRLATENCARLGAACVETFLARIGDLQAAASSNDRELTSAGFDRVLVDTPCSNTGVMRRRVDLRWRVSTEEIARLQRTQLTLLSSALKFLKPGGTFLYSTCSLEPEENQGVVKAVLDQSKGVRLEHERELLPFSDAVDGAYVARIVRD